MYLAAILLTVFVANGVESNISMVRTTAVQTQSVQIMILGNILLLETL